MQKSQKRLFGAIFTRDTFSQRNNKNIGIIVIISQTCKIVQINKLGDKIKIK